MRKSLLATFLLLSTMQVAAADFETAVQAVRNMKVGWNLGNTLDANNGSRMTDITQSETYWGQPVTRPELMQMLSEAGFGAMRIPVTWFPHMNEQGIVDPAWMERVHEVVDYVINAGMYCILNIHHDTGADSDGHKTWLKADEKVYNQVKDRYESLWKQIAEEFRDYDQRLLFESYNEMLDSYNSWCFASFSAPNSYNATVATSAYNAINSYAQSFVNIVRSTGGNNAQRNLVVNTYGACCGAGTWNSHLKDPLKQMKLPADDVSGHLIFQVHTYPNISNDYKSEINDMISALKTNLVSKGAPVIFGEWGSSAGEDYYNKNATLMAFANYFVTQAKANDMGTFLWMGLTDGSARALPYFSQPDLARTILQAYYGIDYSPKLPTKDDFDITYTVNYSGQWQELNLCDTEISLANYKAISVELDEVPKSGYLSVKVYGENNKTQNTPIADKNFTVTFNHSSVGSKASRVTLQYNKTDNYSVTVNRVCLIRTDGTEQEMNVSPFWGCTIVAHATPKTTDIALPVAHEASSSALYNLSGLRVVNPRPGVYIRDGQKLVVR